MGALRAWLLVALFLVPVGAVAQDLPDPTVVGGPVNEAYDTVTPPTENETGQDLTTEEIDLSLLLNIRDAEFDLVGVLFGGGKAETEIEARLHLEFRAVSVERLEPVLEQIAGDANVSLSGTFGINTSRQVLTAEEVRTAGGGVLLEAFQAYQEEATRERLEEAVPGVTVLSARFDWSNTLPAEPTREDQEPPDLREPPLVLDAQVVLRFLDRFSVVELVEAAQEDEETPEETAEEALRQRIEENQTVPLGQRDAFMLMGIGQLLSMDLPPGWRLNLTVTVPQGFIFSSATDALVLSEDRRTATYFLDGSDRSTPAAASGVVTLSNRFLVTITLVLGALAAGHLLRVPAELAAGRVLTQPAPGPGSQPSHQVADGDDDPREHKDVEPG